MNLKHYCFSKWLLVFASVAMCNFAFAQRTITGTVTDGETGETLIGVNILVVGTSTGTITDFDGAYSLAIPDGATEVRYSYTGFAAHTVDLTQNPSNIIDVGMKAGEILDEVVVIGYGTVKKGDATGSVNAISNEDFNRGAIISPEQLLTGKVAGVQITPNSGEPGSKAKIRIRGGTSVTASNEPLYVIDGVPIDNAPHDPGGGLSGGRNPLNFLNPSDIETFTVLKDASAAAIYGSRGANGVIIITTKKGKKGSKGRVSYDGYYSTTSLQGEIDNLKPEAFKNVVTFVAPSRLGDLGDAETDWFKEMTQTAIGHNHSLSFSGGGENMGYRASVGYMEQEGIVKTSETQRTSISLNYNHSLFDGRLNINANLKGSFTKDRFGAPIGDGWDFDPTQPVYDPDNVDFGGYFEYGKSLASRNPVSTLEQIDERGKNFRNIGNIELEYKFDDFIPGLSAKANFGFDINNGERKKFTPTTYSRPPVDNFFGEVRRENMTRTNDLLDFYLNYKKNLGTNHSFNITGGYSFQEFRGEFPSSRAYNLTTDIFGFNSPRPATDFEVNNSVVENRLISFFGRANYTFKDKYLLTVTVRRDGSTRFGEANRWGTFPSAALAWRILEEDFASGLGNIFSDLKLRIGYGITGNQDIKDFGYLPTYTLSDSKARFQFGDEFVTTARPDGYDANLKWEETSSYNIGLDFGFSNGRINGSLEYYFKKTEDLLFTVAVPAGTNLTDQVLTNIGELNNQGVELTLDAYVIDNKDFSWNIGFNAAYNDNEIVNVSVTEGQGILTGDISGGVGNKIQILQVGQPINSFFVFKHKLDADGKPLVDGVDHNDDGVIDLADMYEDLDGDGTVDPLGDKRPLEKPAPDIMLGLTTNLNYKGFDLAATLRSNIGNYVYNNNASEGGWFNNLSRVQGALRNMHTSVLETNFYRTQLFSDYYLEDGSFIKLDNVTLGYTFDLEGSTSLRVYATGTNLLTLTEYSGLEPEVDNGIDNRPYPRSRGFIFGLSLGL